MRANHRQALASGILAILLLGQPLSAMATATPSSSGAPAATQEGTDPAPELARVLSALAPFRDLAPGTPLAQILAAAFASGGTPVTGAPFRYTAPESGDDPLAEALRTYGTLTGIADTPSFSESLASARTLPPGMQKTLAPIVFALADAEALVRGGSLRPGLAALRDEHPGLTQQQVAALIVGSAVDQATPGLKGWTTFLRALDELHGIPEGGNALTVALALSVTATPDTAGDGPLARALDVAGSPVPLSELKALVREVKPDLLSELQLLYAMLGVRLDDPTSLALREYAATLPPEMVDSVARLLWAENRASLLREAIFVAAASRETRPVDPALLETLLRSPSPDAETLEAIRGGSAFLPTDLDVLGYSSGLVVAATDVAREALLPFASAQASSTSPIPCPTSRTVSFCEPANDIWFKDPLNLIIVSGTGSTRFDDRYAIPGLSQYVYVSADRRHLENQTRDGFNDSEFITGDRHLCVASPFQGGGNITCAAPTILSLYGTGPLVLTEGFESGGTRVPTSFRPGNETRVLDAPKRGYQVITLDLGGNDHYTNNQGGADPLVMGSYTIDPVKGQSVGLLNTTCDFDGLISGCRQRLIDMVARSEPFYANVSGVRTNLTYYNAGVRLNATGVPNPIPIAAVALDIGGSDTYATSRNWTQGAASLGGVGVLIDYGTNPEARNTFTARTNATGAANDGGFALLASIGPAKDTYKGHAHVQGSTGAYLPAFGIPAVPGEECERSTNLRVVSLNTNGANPQGTLAPTFAFLVDADGDDTYEATCMAQGKSSGGVGLLWDLAGEDTYRIEKHGQGYTRLDDGVFVIVRAYTGILLDEGGDDTYVVTKPTSPRGSFAMPFTTSQGSADGGGPAAFLDLAGNDTGIRTHERPQETYYGSNERVRTWSTGFYGSAMEVDLAPGADIDALLQASPETMLLRIEDTRVNSYHNKSDWAIFGLAGYLKNTHRMNYSVLIDLGGDDEYFNNAGAIWINDRDRDDPFSSADRDAQSDGPGRVGTGTTRGETVALLLDLGGNDVYDSRTPTSGTEMTFSQGAASSGMVGMLVDTDGRDTYHAKNWSQGSATRSNSIGFLADLAGDDAYHSHNYSQGVGALGGTGFLFDGSGDDKYFGATLSQAVASKAGFLVDLSGSDDYTLTGDDFPRVSPANPLRFLKGAGQGLATAPSGVAVLFDGSGNDDYASPSNWSHGYLFGTFFRDADLNETNVLDIMVPTPVPPSAAAGLAVLADDAGGRNTYAPPNAQYHDGFVTEKRANNYWSPNFFTVRGGEGQATETHFVAIGLDNLTRALNRYAADAAFLAGSGDGRYGSQTGTAPAGEAATASAPKVTLAQTCVDCFPGHISNTIRLTASLAETHHREACNQADSAGAPAPIPGSRCRAAFFVETEDRHVWIGDRPVGTDGKAVLTWNTTSHRDAAGVAQGGLITPDGPAVVKAYVYVPASAYMQGREPTDEGHASYYVGTASRAFTVNNGPVVLAADVPAFNPAGERKESRMVLTFSELPVQENLRIGVAPLTGFLAPQNLPLQGDIEGPTPAGFYTATATWDGRLQGELMAEGVFRVVVEATDADGLTVVDDTLRVVIDPHAPTAHHVAFKPYLNLTNTRDVVDGIRSVRNHTLLITGEDAGLSGIAHYFLRLEAEPLGDATVTCADLPGSLPADDGCLLQLPPTATSVLLRVRDGTFYNVTLTPVDRAGNVGASVTERMLADFSAPISWAAVVPERPGNVTFPLRFGGDADIRTWRVEFRRESTPAWTPLTTVTLTEAEALAALRAGSTPEHEILFDTSTLTPAVGENETFYFRTLAMDVAGNRESSKTGLKANVDPHVPVLDNITVTPYLRGFLVTWDTDRATVANGVSAHRAGDADVLVLNNKTARSHSILVGSILGEGAGLKAGTQYQARLFSTTYQNVTGSETITVTTTPSLLAKWKNPDPAKKVNILTGRPDLEWLTAAVPRNQGGDPWLHWSLAVSINGSSFKEVSHGLYYETSPLARPAVRGYERFPLSLDIYPESKNAVFRLSVNNTLEETAAPVTVIIDHKAPETTLDLAHLGGQGWYTQNPELRFKFAEVASGVAYTNYTFNGVNGTYRPDEPFFIPDGVHTLSFQSVDRAGLREAIVPATVRVDAQAPTGTVTLLRNGQAVRENVTSLREVTLLIKAQDPVDGSGLDAVLVTTNATPLAEDGWYPFRSSNEMRLDYELPQTAGLDRSFTVYVRDKAHNVRAIPVTIRLDAEPPSIVTDSLRITNVGFTQATLRWETSESSATRLAYGFHDPAALLECGCELWYEEPGFRTVHEVTLLGLTPGRVYDFRIHTEDILGNADSYEAPRYTFTTTQDMEAPGQVRDLKVVNLGDGTVLLTWTPAEDNVGVDRYLVLRQPVGHETFGVIDIAYGTRYLDTRASAGAEYAYSVVALDASDNRGPDAAASEVTVATRPVLGNVRVTPDVGTAHSTTFRFLVSYKDLDEGADAKPLVWIVIDGVRHPMRDMGADPATPGSRLFAFETRLNETGLATGLHSYYFLATDGTHEVRFPETGDLKGPVVQNPDFADSDAGLLASALGRWRDVAGGSIALVGAAVAIAAILRWRRFK